MVESGADEVAESLRSFVGSGEACIVTYAVTGMWLYCEIIKPFVVLEEKLFLNGNIGKSKVRKVKYLKYCCFTEYCDADKGTYTTAKEILNMLFNDGESLVRDKPVILVGNKCDLVRKRQVSTNGKSESSRTIFTSLV